jgi:hypothetical protein
MRFALIISAFVTVTTVYATTCDIFKSANVPCVAAHSTVRSLFSDFDGALYQVRRSSDNHFLDVPVESSGGFANTALQDEFCAGTDCVIWRIYDQSSFQNHLDIAPAGGAHRQEDNPVNATRDVISISGHKVYGAYFEGNMGYRNDRTKGVATGNDPETLYAVMHGRHFNGGCCFDYGNAETNNLDTGKGSMEAIYFGNSSGWGHGSGDGPWLMADLENGLWPGNNTVNPGNTPLDADFVTLMVKGGNSGFALKGGDATKGQLDTKFDGARPNGYQPMKKQGAIILGIGGDNSAWSIGTFYEGVMTAGYTTDETDNAIQANIVKAGYGS